MNFKDIKINEISQLKKDKLQLYEADKIVKFIESKSRTAIVRV